MRRGVFRDNSKQHLLPLGAVQICSPSVRPPNQPLVIASNPFIRPAPKFRASALYHEAVLEYRVCVSVRFHHRS
jgi:hypothetical protein